MSLPVRRVTLLSALTGGRSKSGLSKSATFVFRVRPARMMFCMRAMPKMMKRASNVWGQNLAFYVLNADLKPNAQAPPVPRWKSSPRKETRSCSPAPSPQLAKCPRLFMAQLHSVPSKNITRRSDIVRDNRATLHTDVASPSLGCEQSPAPPPHPS